MQKKIWFRMFIRVAAIFAGFVALLAAVNGGFLGKYYIWREKNALVDMAGSIRQLELKDAAATLQALERLNAGRNFLIDIYDQDGKMLYTTYGQQIWDFSDFPVFAAGIRRRPLQTLEQERREDGSWFITAMDESNNAEYIIYQSRTDQNDYIEIRVQKSLLEKSAGIANEFILILAGVFLAGALVWIVLFSKSFTRPIVEMNAITRDMAGLQFQRKLVPASKDEIGQLACSINDLSTKLDATLTDLREKNEKLQDEIDAERRLDSMRRGFVSNVSHELKTPISIIQGYAEGLKLGVSGDKDKREAYCDVILEESVRMNRLVLDLLELSRYESGQIKIEPQDFDMAGLARGLCQKLERRVEEKKVTLALELPPCLSVHADPARMEQVLHNYLSNALSHVPEGGRVRLTGESRDGLARVSVYNTGAGISADDMPQIWQSFYRGDPSHKREEGRFGLGLSIVRAIMELHSRECGVYNTDDGVCFWFTADLAAEEDGGQTGANLV
ncbi:MAG: HAMP domain-containing protein [Clostridiales bacterium]|nr:HAMP domain-containing protein [Clostridiales bacterium]